MGLDERLAKLEKQYAPRKRTIADRLTDAFRAFDERWKAMTPEEREAYVRHRHELALAATPPGSNASELRRQLYDSAQYAARHYFARKGTVDASPVGNDG